MGEREGFNFAPRTFLIPGLIGLALVLRLIGLDARPLDGDEGVILQIAAGPVSHVLAEAARDVHPPLYHLLVSLALVLGGPSAGALRIVSVIAGVALVALGPRLARRVGLPEALVTGALAVSPFLVTMSQDARMYSLFAFLAAASWLTLADLWDDAHEWRQWVLWGFLGAGLVLTHHLGWLVLLSELLVTVLWHRGVFARPWHWLGATACIFVSYWPQLATTLAQVSGRLSEQSYEVSFGARAEHIVGAVYRMLAGRTFLDLGPDSFAALLDRSPGTFFGLLVTLLVPAALVLLGAIHLAVTARSLFRDWAVFMLVGIGSAVAVGTIALHAPRYLGYLAPFLIVIATVGVREIWPTVWGRVAVVAMIGVAAAGIWAQLGRDARAPGANAYAEAIMNQQSSSRDAIVVRGAFAGGETKAFIYEWQRVNEQAAEREGRPLGMTLPPYILDLFADYRPGNLAELRAVSPATTVAIMFEPQNGFDRVWFFDQTYAENPLQGLSGEYVVEIQELGRDKEQMPLRLYLIQTRDARR